MQYIQEKVEEVTGKPERLNAFKSVYRISQRNSIRYWFWGILGSLLIIMFLPWTQNIRSRGMVTSLYQEQRPQELNTIISGRIVKWHIKEGDMVKAGDTIVELAEVKDDYLDPQLLTRTREQLTSKKEAVEGYKGKVSTIERQLQALEQARILKMAELENKIQQQQFKIRSDSMDLIAATNDFGIKKEQFRRQQVMYDSGLVSLALLEQRNQAYQESMAKRTSAEIKLSNARQELLRLRLEWNGEQQQYLEKISKAEGDRYQSLSQIASGTGDIAKMENQYMNYNIRNGQYIVRAPQDGQVIKARKQGINEIIKEGEMLVEIVPSTPKLAVELFVKPVDLPLVDTGQNVRFIFDGFPAIVFSGWPQASYGTFSGKIIAVERSVGTNGLFRILVTEQPGEKKWPMELRMGTGASGIALLKNVSIWYELWRNINGFPPDYYRTSENSKNAAKK